ncbi:uncharacterized protein BDV14DRAFT_188121 [Aspergillus stella-maris]|uniref:uncharacterized protein n=1 Tax=Aspergillus stella-maris TaxID=1810926 RepID=UPI003CCD9FDA
MYLRKSRFGVFSRPEQWRSILRSLLRESSYLPDPVARGASQDQILRRFRRFHEDKRDHIKEDTERLKNLHRESRKTLYLLQRANEGYLKSLEKVLKLAYGRTGRRRTEFLNKLLALDAPQDSEAVDSLVNRPAMFEEGWEPPKVVVELMNSQRNNPFVNQINERRLVKRSEPPVDVKNSWGRHMPMVRKRNIRIRWYNDVLGALLPPLPDAELQVLDGLIAGEIPWSLPKRRARPRSEVQEASDKDPRGEAIRQVLTDGPQKEGTFGPYVDGRPHNITRRYMIRLWRRISCLVPRQHWDAEFKKWTFNWDSMSQPQLAVSAKEESAQEIFTGLHTPQQNKRKRHQTAINPVS